MFTPELGAWQYLCMLTYENKITEINPEGLMAIYMKIAPFKISHYTAYTLISEEGPDCAETLS